jgi:hypothetical protein
MIPTSNVTKIYYIVSKVEYVKTQMFFMQATHTDGSAHELVQESLKCNS